MSRGKAALNVDAPVTLDELLDRNARETLAAGAPGSRRHAGGDRSRRAAPARRSAAPGDDRRAPRLRAGRARGRRRRLGHRGGMLAHEGDAIGWLIVRGEPQGSRAAPAPRRRRLHRRRHQARDVGAHAHGHRRGGEPRADREEPPPGAGGRAAAGGRSGQVELPRHRVARAAHAADVGHRLLRDAARGHRRRAQRRAARVRAHGDGEGRPAARSSSPASSTSRAWRRAR